MDNPIKMDDLGVPLFSETSIYTVFFATIDSSKLPCEHTFPGGYGDGFQMQGWTDSRKMTMDCFYKSANCKSIWNVCYFSIKIFFGDLEFGGMVDIQVPILKLHLNCEKNKRQYTKRNVLKLYHRAVFVVSLEFCWFAWWLQASRISWDASKDGILANMLCWDFPSQPMSEH